MTTSYTDVFGNQTVPPSQYQYQNLALTANDTFYLPSNYSGTGMILAKINVIASATGAYTLTLPDATQASTGLDALFINNSAQTVTLHDASGGNIGSVTAGAAKYVYLEDNTTVAGAWGIIIYGNGSSIVDAAALAGYGIKATGITISQAIPVTETSLTVTVSATTGRAQAYVFTGGSVACTLPTAVVAGADFFFYVKNGGTGTITITPTGGDVIDDVATLGLNPQESCIVFSSGTDWHTVGLGRSTQYQFTKLVKDLTGLSSYTLTSSDASNKLIQFTGSPSALTTVTAPAVVAIYYVEMSTSNAYSAIIKTAAGTGVTLTTNARSILYCDGVNIVAAQTSTAPAAATTIINDTTTNATMYPVWVTGSTGDLASYVSSTKYSFNPSTGTLTVTAIISNVTGYSTALKSATTTVDVAAATAPSANQVLTATNSTTATWKDLPASGPTMAKIAAMIDFFGA